MRRSLVTLSFGFMIHLTALSADGGAKMGDALTQPVGFVDMRGNTRSLADYAGSKIRVVCFLATECPVANAYLPILVEMEKDWRGKGVQFLGVFPQASDSVDDIASHTYDRHVPFPVFKDQAGLLAQTLGIERVPTVCVIDHESKLRYRGRIDDQFGVGTRRPKASSHDLATAINALVDGKTITSPETLADGCKLSAVAGLSVDGEITYAKHVAGIFQNKCEECHRTGRIGPFTLASYQDAVEWSAPIKEVLLNRLMPPWHADQKFGDFHNNRSLTDQERDTILRWIDTGKAKGNDSDLPPAKVWADDWEMGKPDLVLKLPKPQAIPATGVMPYRYVVVPTNFTEDKWIVAAEGKPGNPAVVHHIIVYLMSPEKPDPFREGDGEMNVLTEWAPGNGPVMASPGTAMRVPAGATLLIEMHYTPNGKETTDQSMVGMKFTDNPPERIIRANLFANERIIIPARDPHHPETEDYTFEEDSRILAFLPHMHWRGKHFEYVALYPDGKTERLLSVPRWDFNWQTGYWFREPLRIPKGTTIRATATWDNSANNKANPDPEKDVYWGLQTWEEMMVGWMYYVRESTDQPSVVHKKNDKPKKLPSAGMFRVMDRDKNGWVAGKEIPPQFRPLLEQIGLDLEPGLDPVAYEFIYQIIMGSMKRGPQEHNTHQNEPRPAEETARRDQTKNQ